MGDGRAEGLSATGDRGQAAASLMPDADGMHVCSSESLKPEGFYERDLTIFGIFFASCVCLLL